MADHGGGGVSGASYGVWLSLHLFYGVSGASYDQSEQLLPIRKLLRCAYGRGGCEPNQHINLGLDTFSRSEINQRKQWQMALGVQWQVCTNKIMCYDYANSCHMTHLQTHLNGGEQWHFPYRFHDNRAEFWHHVTMNSLQWLLWLLLRLVPFLCPDAVHTKNFMEGTLLQYGGHEELQMVHEMELLTPYC
uniref:Uncharacterized protein n=1 Tax=Oryza sativa subsp. japonica TaxID=39947 RepID=Q75K47_ORYSJ|nr:hypothetical protein [Oryza sativa Japonica Group]